MTMRRLPTNRIFRTKQYRIYNRGVSGNESGPYVSYYKKRRTSDDSFSYARTKVSLIKTASCRCHLDVVAKLDESETSILDNVQSSSRFNEDEDINHFDFLPREIILHILNYVDARDLCNFACTCYNFRRLSYDNQLWKVMCFKDWANPNYLLIVIENYERGLHKWFNSTFDMEVGCGTVLNIYKENLWRLIYCALETQDIIPSIVIGRGIVGERSIECFPVRRVVQYTSTAGVFKLKGISSVSRLEHTVHDFEVKPWHKTSCIETRPLPIYDLRTYGLRQARTVRGQHNVGFFNRRGYYLKTDLNRKIHLSYRYFPALRYRLYVQYDRVFLLCQDLVINGGMASHCYTMYEVLRIGEPESLPIVSNLATESSAEDNETETSTEEEDEEGGEGNYEDGVPVGLTSSDDLLSLSDDVEEEIRNSESIQIFESSSSLNAELNGHPNYSDSPQPSITDYLARPLQTPYHRGESIPSSSSDCTSERTSSVLNCFSCTQTIDNISDISFLPTSEDGSFDRRHTTTVQDLRDALFGRGMELRSGRRVLNDNEIETNQDYSNEEIIRDLDENSSNISSSSSVDNERDLI